MKLILASASPRRKEILAKAGYKFEIIPSLKEEVVDKSLSAEKVAEALAYQKAKDIFDKTQTLTLGADTIVVLNGEILGKPKSAQHSIEMLSKLSGKTHLVITGYALINQTKTIVSHDVSKVVFNDLSMETIEKYTSLKLGMDKAGGYGAQDNFGLVKSVEGSLNNVIGLPIEKIELLLKEVENEN